MVYDLRKNFKIKGDPMIKVHPFSVIIYSSVLFLITLSFSHPLYILSLLLIIVLNIVILGHRQQLINTLKYGLPTAILIIIVNPLVSQKGRTVIWQGLRLPVLGTIKITFEALSYGFNMAAKLICIMFVFLLYSILTDQDESFSFFSKYAHKLTLILSMTTNIIHKLRLEIMRVKDVMILRGVRFDHKSPIKRIKVYYPILKVILISALEGSLDRAEALYSRGYGETKRTAYSKIKMNNLDYIFIVSNIILFLVFVASFVKGIGRYEFYPVLKGFTNMELLYIIFIDFILLIPFFLIWGCKRWKFLK